MKLFSRQFYAVIVVIAVGVVLAMLVLNTNKPETDKHDEHAGHDDHQASKTTENNTTHPHEEMPAEIVKGPHGGKLFKQDAFAIEVTIFEQNVPPQFRLYAYFDGKPLKPGQSNASITLERLGRPAQTISFAAEADYLKGDAVIVEPHSFKATIDVQSQGKPYRFAYEQTEARVQMSDSQLSHNAIEVLTAAPARIKSTLQLTGEIKMNADKTVYVVPRLGGIVESVMVNAGDSVRKGQVLAVVSSQSLADQRSDYLAAQKRLALSRVTFEREKSLWEQRITAEQDYLQAQQAMFEAEIELDRAKQKLNALGAATTGSLTRYEIRSPINGMVTEKQIAPGQVVREDSPIFMVADLSSVWAEITVYAKDLKIVRLGQQAKVKSGVVDTEAVGTVSYVGAVVGEQSRTATARVVLANPKALWQPGVPVSIELVAEEVEVPLAVAVEALQSVRDWTVVFGRYGEQFEARPIELGRGDEHHVEVLEGLLPGEKYAAKNSFLIKAELGKAGASHDH
ncbi:MAG: efflux RND transporter periplasmic adaptor subunit [Methylophilaceae bacterium]